ncbi:flagellar protein FlaG [Shouchella sp. JSM 1781072]|uniref:flagellar protein FlaG n=1 Tax=Bacillaceae TaxID=186817 RepID=UPI000C0853A1|nr:MULTISPECIES: flagellar protein FlaG [Bacillaceae]UTR05605.1 flagellar protein FlaG [Alkalihalobacillus sp. LMS6]
MEIHSAGNHSFLSDPLYRVLDRNQNRTETENTLATDEQKVKKRALSFHIHSDLGRVYVKVVDSDTEEVVREVPPEQLLNLVASMMKSAGLIIDRQV